MDSTSTGSRLWSRGVVQLSLCSKAVSLVSTDGMTKMFRAEKTRAPERAPVKCDANKSFTADLSTVRLRNVNLYLRLALAAKIGGKCRALRFSAESEETGLFL